MVFDAVAAVFLTGFVFGVLVGALATRSCCRRGSSPRPPPFSKAKEKPHAKARLPARCRHQSVLRQHRHGMFELSCSACGMVIIRQPTPVDCEHLDLDYSGSNQHGPRMSCKQCKKVLVRTARDEAARHDD